MSYFFEKPGICPLCRSEGTDVPYDTVLSFAQDFMKGTVSYGQYYLCVNPVCEVVYFSSNQNITVKEVKDVPWYKTESKRHTVCYCRNITMDDIIHVVSINGESTPEQIVKYYGKENIPADCIHNMPTGESCDILFLHAIESAQKLIGSKKKNV